MVSRLANSSFKSQLHPFFFRISVSVRGAVWGILKETELSQRCCPLFGHPKWTLGRTRCLSASQEVKDTAVGHQLTKNLTSPRESPPITSTRPVPSKLHPSSFSFLGPLVQSSGVLPFLIFGKTKSYRDKSYPFVSLCKVLLQLAFFSSHLSFPFQDKDSGRQDSTFNLLGSVPTLSSTVSQVNWNPHLIKCPRSEFPGCWSPLFRKFTILWP